jgi:hypothetical protein
VHAEDGALRRVEDRRGLSSEPKTPPLVMVNVPPSRSATAILFAGLLRQLADRFSMSAKLSLSASRMTGTISPFSVLTATPMS